nr:hypothetical protein [Limosilactobacillus albertensis]
MHVYRGNIGYKYSVHLRFTNNNVHLIRLCINGSRHHNEDGTIVGKNHLHIYKYHDSHIEDYAYDLNHLPFDNSDELDAAVEKFINYANIKGKEE